MRKNQQNVILLIEPSEDPFLTPSKIGNLFLNRFGIDEDARFEILGILLLQSTSRKLTEQFYNINKEQYDKQVFDRAVKLAMEGNNGLETHFIYAGEHYLDFSQRIEQLLQFKMRRYKLKSAVLTLINMQRWDVVTKETMVQGYKGRAQQTYIAEILLLKGLPISVLRIFQYTFTNDF